MYSRFKSVLSDGIGYFYVASSVNMDEKEKSKMMNAADTFFKICGNISILMINQIVLIIFNEYWKEL
jgi:hypothetical protein